MQAWVWVNWRGESYAIDASKIVCFGRSLKAEREIWFALDGEEERHCDDVTLAEFCALIKVPYQPSSKLEAQPIIERGRANRERVVDLDEISTLIYE